MRRRLMWLLFSIALVGLTGDEGLAGSQVDQFQFDSVRGKVHTSVQCVGGYKFAVASLVGHQSAPSPSISIIQVYEDNAGRVIPAKCS